MKKSPCTKDCPDRQAGCHSKDCPHGWFEWNENHVKNRETAWREKNIRYVEHSNMRFVSQDGNSYGRFNRYRRAVRTYDKNS